MVTPRWVDDDAGLAEVVDALRDEPRYALDTEFLGERSYFPRLALVQLAWPGDLALVDPLAVDPTPLSAVLAGPATMIAHAGDQDLAILERACGTTPSHYFDTQVAAGFLGLGTPSLAALAERVLDVRLTKGDRLTDWTRRPLNDAQRRYAATDVEHLLALHVALGDRLDDAGRRAWAEAECQARLARDRTPQDPDTAWWRVKGARSLRGDARGVAQEVAAWRERTAQQRDLPARFVLSDLALAGIVARPPRSVDELVGLRGVDQRVARDGTATRVLDAVHRGRELDPADLRLPPRGGGDRSLNPAVALVAAWVGERADELGVETALLATRADLADLIERRTGRLTDGWRAEIVGEPIRRLVAGEAVLVLADGGRRLVLQDQRPG